METEDLKKQLKFRLGAPTVNVELTDEQIDEAVKVAKDEFTLVHAQHSVSPLQKSIWQERFALAVCKEMLGRVRGKFGKVDAPGVLTDTDAKELLKEAKNEKKLLYNLFK